MSLGVDSDFSLFNGVLGAASPQDAFFPFFLFSPRPSTDSCSLFLTQRNQHFYSRSLSNFLLLFLSDIDPVSSPPPQLYPLLPSRDLSTQALSS